jgi:hypothetical protein
MSWSAFCPVGVEEGSLERRLSVRNIEMAEDKVREVAGSSAAPTSPPKERGSPPLESEEIKSGWSPAEDDAHHFPGVSASHVVATDMSSCEDSSSIPIVPSSSLPPPPSSIQELDIRMDVDGPLSGRSSPPNYNHGFTPERMFSGDVRVQLGWREEPQQDVGQEGEALREGQEAEGGEEEEEEEEEDDEEEEEEEEEVWGRGEGEGEWEEGEESTPHKVAWSPPHEEVAEPHTPTRLRPRSPSLAHTVELGRSSSPPVIGENRISSVEREPTPTTPLLRTTPPPLRELPSPIIRKPTPPLPSPIIRESTPRLPSPPPLQPTPPPAPAPKVKMSLKDFAARKKKQREVECKNGGSVEVSPLVSVKALVPEGDGGIGDQEGGVKVGETAAPVVGDLIRAVDRVPAMETVAEPVGGANNTVTPAQVDGTPLVNGHVKDEDVEMDDVATEKVSVCNKDPKESIPVASLPNLTPVPPPSDPTRDTASLKAKTELIEHAFPNGTRDFTSVQPPSHSNGNTSLHKTPNAAALPAKPRVVAQRTPLVRQPSHEDGEISTAAPTVATATAITTATTATDDVPPPPAKRTPTGPRFLRASPPYPQASQFQAPQVQGGNIGRPVPSAPRALRTNGANVYYTTPTVLLQNRAFLGMQALPRGPSADRERMEWDRDRSWTANSRTRGGAGGSRGR